MQKKFLILKKSLLHILLFSSTLFTHIRVYVCVLYFEIKIIFIYIYRHRHHCLKIKTYFNI